jgi:universal stress protein A
MRKTCRILVPADFSASSDAALDYATSLAWRVGATVDLLHVWDLDATAQREGPRTAFFADSCDGMAMEQALSRTQHGRVEVRGRLEFGELSETIARVATSDHFDLVVMGRGTERPSSLPNSDNVARDVALAVRCPVITIRATMEPEYALGPWLPEAAPGSADDDALGSD